MLVVTLIGVLALVAYPIYSGYQDRVHSHTAAQHILAMSQSIQNYRTDNGAYPDSLADVNLAGATDPWGRPFVYYNTDARGRGGARKDHALNPINTDFDLYSLGPDGKTKPQISQKDSVDDVIRGRNGAFVGIAADF